MRKIIYIAITFIICSFLKLQNIWFGFAPVFLLMSFFKTEKNLLWEIPLAVMLCDVLLIVFSEELRMLIYILSLISTALISITSTRKLFFLFPIIILAVTNENMYMVSALWATIWYALHFILGYFTTKQFALQEYKSHYVKNQTKNC